MVRNNFLFFKDIKSRYISMFFFDCFENNFIFFKKSNKILSINTKFISIKKINVNKQCINIIYF